MSDACNCCAGSHCEPTDPTTCSNDIHGQCREPGGGCLVGESLHRYLARTDDPVLLLFAGGTFNALDELRDTLLEGTPLGNQLLDYNRRFAGDGMALLDRQPDILQEAVHAFLVAASFSRALLREAMVPGSEDERRWTQAAAHRAEAVIQRAMGLSGDAVLHQVLRHLSAINQRCIGLNPGDVLRLLQAGETFRDDP